MTDESIEDFCDCEDGPQFERHDTTDGVIKGRKPDAIYCCRCEKPVDPKDD